MATVNGYTAERMKQIEDSAIVGGTVAGDNLILTRYDNSTINAGSVRGPQGVQGPIGATTIPAGAIMMWSTITAPTGWLIADGSAISRSTYSALFTAIGTSYGIGDGTTTFNLPNLKGRIPVGTDSSQIEFNTNGKTGGEKAHILTLAEVAAHTHSIDPPNTVTDAQGDHYHNAADGYPFITTGAGGTGMAFTSAGGNPTTTGWSAQGPHAHNLNIGAFNSSSVGSGTAHNILQPYISLPFIVKT